MNKQGCKAVYLSIQCLNLLMQTVSLCQSKHPTNVIALLCYHILWNDKAPRQALCYDFFDPSFTLTQCMFFSYHITSNKISLHSFDILCLVDSCLETSNEVSNLSLESFCLANIQYTLKPKPGGQGTLSQLDLRQHCLTGTPMICQDSNKNISLFLATERDIRNRGESWLDVESMMLTMPGFGCVRHLNYKYSSWFYS